MGTNKKDLRHFIRYDGNGRVIPGGNILQRTKPKVGRWTETSAYECCDPCIPTFTDAPAPTNIHVTVDAVGDHPITYYFRIFYCYYGSIPDNGYDYIYRSLASDEITFIVGDDTTLITLTCDSLPGWANEIDWYIGTVSGVYPNGGWSSYAIINIELDDDYDNSYPEMLAVPVYQDQHGCITTTTTCIHQGIYMDTDIIAASYEFNLAVIDFHDSEEAACAALDVINEQITAELIYFGMDVYGDKDHYYIYYAGTCDLIEDGWYLFSFGDEEPTILVVVDGIFSGLYECTTTTTTTIAAVTTTTTTVEVPSDKRLKDDIQPTGNMIGEFKEYTWKWNHRAKALGLHKSPTIGVLAQEVLFKRPELITLAKDGYYRVDVEKLKKLKDASDEIIIS